MEKMFITITGMNYHYGVDFIEKGMELTLIKEKDNEYDNEAIRAEIDCLGKIGYVANSPNTVLGNCYSAGRIYDKIDDISKVKVELIIKNKSAVICELI